MKALLKVISLYKNESALIKKAIENHRDAQRILFETYSPKLLSVCRYYIKDIHHAEEVMLSGFVKVFKHLGSFKNEGSFQGWMHKIMTRECISYLRQQKQLEFVTDDIPETEDNYTDSYSELDVNDIQQLIDQLPEGYKMVFVLYAVEGYKHNEIAKMLGISEGTSKSQLYKARKLLQTKINDLNTPYNGTNKI